MTASVNYQLLSPLNFGYDKDTTIQLTNQRKNQTIDALSNHISGLANACFSLMNVLTCGGCCGTTIQVQPNNDIIVTRYNIITEVLREPGFYQFSNNGLKIHTVYVQGYQGIITDRQMNDKNGFPCNVSAQYNYQVVDPIAATYQTKNYYKFVKEHALIALQKSFAQTSKDHRKEIGKETIKLFESYVQLIGVKINSFKITAVKIDQNMQKIMLAKQEAKAFVKGRKTIAKGAISTLGLSIEQLEESGIKLTQEQKNALALDMTYMICQTDQISLEYIQGDPSPDQMRTLITEQQQRSVYDLKNR
jgi:membrane protease subunit (stomatin/prohibitin family)